MPAVEQASNLFRAGVLDRAVLVRRPAARLGTDVEVAAGHVDVDPTELAIRIAVGRFVADEVVRTVFLENLGNGLLEVVTVDDRPPSGLFPEQFQEIVTPAGRVPRGNEIATGDHPHVVYARLLQVALIPGRPGRIDRRGC